MIPWFLPAFDKFPREASIIAHLLGGYTTIELSLMNCAHVARDDFDTVFKSMFRVRSETSRIDIADAFARHYYRKSKLGTQFEMAISSLRYCLQIRNQYAHCIWYDDYSGLLAFTDMENVAKDCKFVTDFGSLPVYSVHFHLLDKQKAYFFYTKDMFTWLNYEYRIRDGKLSIPHRAAPQQIERPPLRLQEAVRSNQPSGRSPPQGDERHPSGKPGAGP
jgi:hypothetical protein